MEKLRKKEGGKGKTPYQKMTHLNKNTLRGKNIKFRDRSKDRPFT